MNDISDSMGADRPGRLGHHYGTDIEQVHSAAETAVGKSTCARRCAPELSRRSLMTSEEHHESR